MKKEVFDNAVKTLTLSKEELFKAEQTNELIEKLEHLRVSLK